jgi:hypothetical protein
MIVDSELERMSKEVSVTHSKIPHQHLPGRTEESRE